MADSIGRRLDNYDSRFYKDTVIAKVMERLQQKSLSLNSRNLLKEIVYALFLHIKNNTTISPNPLHITATVIYYA